MDTGSANGTLSPRWRWGVGLVLIAGFAILIYVSGQSYSGAPPIPDAVTSPSGAVVFTGDDVRTGQQVFLRYGLMENGSIWGHGAYLGPDFSAAYLHDLALDAAQSVAQDRYGRGYDVLGPDEQKVVDAGVQGLLRQNRYDPASRRLLFSGAEAASFNSQVQRWADYFSGPTGTGGLPKGYVSDPGQIRALTAFFAWTAWASIAPRPGTTASYTNNFPYDPMVGNTPSGPAVLWSALSLITLLAGTAIVLFVFGRFHYLGWKGGGEHVHPHLLPGTVTEAQRATIKYFLVVTLLFLAQVLVGGATAHYRADPGTFYGVDLSVILPSNILRTWHLQLGIFWIATAYVAGGLLLASSFADRDPPGQTRGIHLLFWALVVVVGGSLLGELAGIHQLLGRAWFWLGDQGWEYLDLGRVWQALLAVGLVFWLFLLYRAVAPARRNPERREILTLFLLAAATIPFFYLPAFFYGSRTNFTVVDTWRFWIIHLWVEGFFELFVTVLVAILFFQLGLVTQKTATRIIYLDAILFLGSGLVGTAHHWYWTGQSSTAMAFAALFSAMEVVPLTLLTLDAWDFVKLTRSHCDTCGKRVSIPHKWTFYFLMAVGFWNFVGAGIFGFLINLPVVSYFEVGTLLTPNHGHSALMGVFGMLGMALTVLALRQSSTEEQWARTEKFVRVSFWGLNVGLALMVVSNLFPGGVLQVWDVLNHGYWHARSLEYLSQGWVRTLEWARMPADVIFILFGVVPAVAAAGITYWRIWSRPAA